MVEILIVSYLGLPPRLSAQTQVSAQPRNYMRTNYDKAACALGRLVIVCRYLKHEYTLQAMGESLKKTDTALNVMDGGA